MFSIKSLQEPILFVHILIIQNVNSFENKLSSTLGYVETEEKQQQLSTISYQSKGTDLGAWTHTVLTQVRKQHWLSSARYKAATKSQNCKENGPPDPDVHKYSSFQAVL